MTTSSEDVLLQMGEVRFKKGDGTIYVMNERVAWMAEHRDTVAVSHKFQVRGVHVSFPEGGNDPSRPYYQRRLNMIQGGFIIKGG